MFLRTLERGILSQIVFLSKKLSIYKGSVLRVMTNCCQNLPKQLAMNKEEMLISVRVRISSTISLYLRQMSVHPILILPVPIPDEEKNLS